MSDDIKISVRNLYKIFGKDPRTALKKVRDGMGKAELQRETGHVIGLNDNNIDMPTGKTTVIMGLSGSGKSTLIRQLNRLIEPTAGEAIVNGDNILNYSERRLRRLRQNDMSMVFQKFALLPHRTVMQNSGMSWTIAGKTQRQYADEALKAESRRSGGSGGAVSRTAVSRHAAAGRDRPRPDLEFRHYADGRGTLGPRSVRICRAC